MFRYSLFTKNGVFINKGTSPYSLYCYFRKHFPNFNFQRDFYIVDDFTGGIIVNERYN